MKDQALVPLGAPDGGWQTTPTPMIALNIKDKFVTAYNPRTCVIFNNRHEYGYSHEKVGAYFHISERGDEHLPVKNPNDHYYMRLKDPNEFVISIKTATNILVYDVVDKAVIMMDFYFLMKIYD